MDKRTPIDKILIVDSDPAHGTSLKDALETVGCAVSIFADLSGVVEAAAVRGTDAVVIVPRSSSKWRKDVKHLRDTLMKADRPLAIFCLLRWRSQGPEDRLYGDELNVTVLHEL